MLAAAQHLCRRKKMNDILILAFEYMKIGAVAIGGGYTVTPGRSAGVIRVDARGSSIRPVIS